MSLSLWVKDTFKVKVEVKVLASFHQLKSQGWALVCPYNRYHKENSQRREI